jgi:predicted O-methyltransferase YrrM
MQDPELKKNAIYLISELEAALIKWITGMVGAKKVLELGCFVGYSACVFCEGGAESVTTLELSPDFAAVAEKNIAEAEHAGKVKIVVGRAIGSLEKLEGEQFDLAFIDADKPSYLSYYQHIRQHNLVRPGGLILIDNTLRRGLVASSESPFAGDAKLESEAETMRVVNRTVAEDKGVECVMLPLFDGLTLVRVLG